MAKGTPLAADHHHIHPVRMYVVAAIVLTILMGVTIQASKIDLPGGVVVNNLVAVGIAITKTVVVVGWFMHVKFSTALTKLFAFLGFIWVVLLGGILIDYFFRGHEPVPSWSGVQESALPRRIGSMDRAPLDPIDQNVQTRLPGQPTQ